MKNLKIIVALVLSISLFSCINKEYDTSIKKLDNLKDTLVSIKTNLKEINSNKISLLYDTMMQDIDTIMSYTNVFPENKEWKKAYDIYSDAAHIAKKFFKQGYDKEIEYSENQIKNLITDINNNVVELDSLRIYLKDEVNAVDALNKKVNIQLEISNQIIDKYDRTKPIVNQYIDSLKNTVKH